MARPAGESVDALALPVGQAPEGGVRTVSLVSLGCPKNLVDSEKMLGMLAEAGVSPVSADSDGDDAAGDGFERWDDSAHVEGKSGVGGGASGERPESVPGSTPASTGRAGSGGSFGGADAVVINTCGFLEASKNESLGVIREAIEAKARGEIKRVVVAGCLVQRHRAKMLEWAPGIDALLGVFDRDKVVEAVLGVRPDRDAMADLDASPRSWIAANALQAARDRGMDVTGLTVNGKDGKGVGYFEDDAARLRLTARHHAYLRISEGCNQACAFCTIPSIRGKMRSKPIDRVVREARELLDDGAFELSLIGQDTTSYGDDLGFGLGQVAGDDKYRGGLPRLLREICSAIDGASGKAWLRLMYAYPSNFSDEIIDAFAELASGSHLLPYIDIPLQHASDRMLSMMRRHVSAGQQRDLMHKLRERIPNMAIRTTFISGFPGETEEDHEALLEFVEEIGFDAVGVFEYSREPGTPAGTMEEDAGLAVDAQTKARRKGEIMSLQRDIAHEQAAYLAEQFDPADPMGSGCRFDVLIDGGSNFEVDDLPGPQSVGGVRVMTGRAFFQAPKIDAVIYVASSQPLSAGELVPCVIVASDGYDLIARPVSEMERRVSLGVL